MNRPLTTLRTGWRAISALGLVSVVAVQALAHDVWIEPAGHRASIGSEVAVRIFVGDLPEKEEVAFKKERVARFEAVGPSRTISIAGEEGRTPIGSFRALDPGLHVLVYQTHYSFIELDAGKFTEYLKEDGLEHIIAEREKLGEAERGAKEKYRRFAKSIVMVGDEDGGFDRRVGLLYELIPETPPSKWAPGKELTFRIELQGAPLSGAKVKLVCVADASSSLKARTDPEGRVRFMPTAPGVWYAASVHMLRAPDELQCDWESFWASCSFEIPAATPK